MAIESAAFFRRLARTECLVLLVMVCLCVAAAAQAPALPAVMSGSVVGVTHDKLGQIYRIRVASTGDVLILDTEKGALYQLTPDGTLVTVSAPGVTLKGGGSFWNTGMALDSHDTLYITDRWGTAHFFRVAYDAATKTWPLSAANTWGSNIIVNGAVLSNTYDIDFDPNGNLVVSMETPYDIYRIHLDAAGNYTGVIDTVITGLKYRIPKVHVDRSGNIFFIEDPWDDPSKIVPGVFMIPAGHAAISGDGKGSAEAQCVRVDPNLGDWKGITSDAAGNIYISDEDDNFNGGSGAVVMIPNENGTLNKDHAMVVAPVPANTAVTIDPRGFMWIPQSETDGWAPGGSKAVPGTNGFVKWLLGSGDAGVSPVGTAGGGGTVYLAFSQQTVLGDVKVKQAGSGSDFVLLSSDPNPNPDAITPTQPCTVGRTYHPGDRCPVWGQVNAHLVGSVSGELQLLDTNNNVLSGSSTHIHGIGQGSGLSILVPSAGSPVGSGFTSPKQVAADSAGNSYVADSALGLVLKYPGGTTIGTGLTAPTGVAVDGAGNVYIGDAGQVIKVPAQGSQTVLQSGLGSNLNLAVDGDGNVYVADPDHGRVVKTPNSTTALVMPGATITAGSGFAQPTAVAVDGWGNLFVADGSNLVKVTTLGTQTTITRALSATTGLAVDASGSVYVAQASGLIRIPVIDNALSFNDRASISDISTPAGVAVDPTGNVYVSSPSRVTQLTINSAINFNDIGPVIRDFEADAQAQLFNIGNLPLNLTDFTFAGADAAEFAVVVPNDSPACDPASPTPSGAFCWLGVGLTATAEGARSAILTVHSDAKNAASVDVALAGNAIIDTRPPTKTTIETSPSQLVYPADVTVTMTVTPADGSGTVPGAVILQVTGEKRQTIELQNGVATYSLSQLSGGTYKTKATYQGSDSPSFAVSVGSGQFIVNPAPSTVRWTPAPSTADEWPYVGVGLSHALTVTVIAQAGTPTGKVSFREGSTELAQVTLDADGKATFNTSVLDAGGVPTGTAHTHTITPVYVGDRNFATVSASPVTLQIVNPGVLMTSDTTALSLQAGSPGVVTLRLKSLIKYSDKTVLLACADLPRYAQCTFSNPTPGISADAPATIVVTVSTNVPVNVAANSKSSPWPFASMFGIGLVGLVFGRKTKYDGRVLMMICALLLITGAVAGMAACGNSGYSKTPPAPHVTTPTGNYTLRITATEIGTTRGIVSLPFSIPVQVQ
jgi:hypothetical protein